MADVFGSILNIIFEYTNISGLNNSSPQGDFSFSLETKEKSPEGTQEIRKAKC